MFWIMHQQYWEGGKTDTDTDTDHKSLKDNITCSESNKCFLSTIKACDPPSINGSKLLSRYTALEKEGNSNAYTHTDVLCSFERHWQ